MESTKSQAPQEAKLHFLDYWRIIRIRKTVILAVFLLVVITATLVTCVLPEFYSSVARIKVERDQTDIGGISGQQMMPGYDPYFIQTEFEIIQPEVILTNVIFQKEFNLNQEWGKKFNGGLPYKTMEPEEASKAAGQIMAGNVALHTATNSILMGKLLRESKFVTPNIIRKSWGRIASDVGVTSGSEMLEETGQGIMSNLALGYDWSDGLISNAGLGAVGGALFGGGFTVFSEFNKLSPKALDNAINQVELEQQQQAGEKPIAQGHEFAKAGDELAAKAKKGEKGFVEGVDKAEVQKLKKPKVEKKVHPVVQEFINTKDPNARLVLIKEMEQMFLKSADPALMKGKLDKLRKSSASDEEYGRRLADAWGNVIKGELIAGRLENNDVLAARDQAQANELAARFNLDQAKAELKDAQLNYSRRKDLAAGGYIAQSDFDAAEARYSRAVAAVAAQ